MKIIIDPGHSPACVNGGKSGYKEHQGMWELSRHLMRILQAKGATVSLTRTYEADVALSERGKKAAGCDVFISQHSNAANGAARGVECFYSVQRPGDKKVAALISAEIAKFMNTTDRGGKIRESTNTKNRDYYTVIDSAIMAGVKHAFLVENGFHDNAQDESCLADPKNLEKIAQIQADIILTQLGGGAQGGSSGAASTQKTAAPQSSAANPSTAAKQTSGSIMGKNTLTAQQLSKVLLSKNPSPNINCTPLELAKCYIEEGEKEGVRGDVAFFQSTKETGWFRFGGQVLPQQNNFAGIGALNNQPQGKGAWFPTPREGIRAQLQHLKAYACCDDLCQPCADPRFKFVKRGIAPEWKDLNGKWAVPGDGYGEAILKLYDAAKSSC